MVARPAKRTPRTRATRAKESDLVVVLESMRGEFRVFGEALQAFGGELHALRGEMYAFRDEMYAFRSEMYAFRGEMYAFRDEMYAFRNEVNVRLDRMESRQDRTERDLGLVKDAVLANTREVKGLKAVVERKVDRDEVVAFVEGIVRRGT